MELANILFVIRRSPDWPSLAEDFRQGLPIAPDRYLPGQAVPGFPDNVAQSIARWNATYDVDFFTCRTELRRIARRTLDAVRDGVVLGYRDLPKRMPAEGERLFFVDDDDWFAPDTRMRMSGVGDEDVAVFPLLRLDAPVFTFARERRETSPLIGLVSKFSDRYQTNNYALHPRMFAKTDVYAMADHIEASRLAGAMHFSERYHDVMLSATNKSPVSASVICRIMDDAHGLRPHVANFINALREIRLPQHGAWMQEPIEQTIDLFARAMGTCGAGS